MKTLLTLALIIFFATPALAIDWPQTPVVGIIGSSIDTERSPFGMFIGGSHNDTEGALAAQRRGPHPFAIVNEAEGGSFVDPVSQTLPDGTVISWIGYEEQLERIKFGTVWNPPIGDGISRLSAVFIGIPNDLLHTQIFSVAAVYAYTDKIKALVDSAGVPVFIPGYPPWADEDGDKGLNMQKAAPIFFLQNPITKENYQILSDIHRQELSDYPGVVYVDMYDDYEHLGDYLHPNRSQDRAAAILYHELFRVLELNK